MNVVFILTILIYTICLFLFRNDFWLCHKSILKDRFFLCLILFPVAITFFLCVPLWRTTDLLFSHEGYDNFIELFKLPVWILSLTATITAAYTFHYSSKQKSEENSVLKKTLCPLPLS